MHQKQRELVQRQIRGEVKGLWSDIHSRKVLLGYISKMPVEYQGELTHYLGDAIVEVIDAAVQLYSKDNIKCPSCQNHTTFLVNHHYTDIITNLPSFTKGGR